MKTILFTTCKALGWLGLCLIMAWLGYVLSMADASELYQQGLNDTPLPSVRQLQEALGVKQDGIVGPVTLAAWDKLYCQQEASKWDYLYKEKAK